jgi:hypothetical protein
MDRHGHAAVQRRAAGIHARGPVRPYGEVIMLISPIVMMVGKEVNTHPKFCRQTELRSICQLAMLQRETVIRIGMRLQSCCQFFQNQLRGLIAVGVGMHLHPSLQGQMQ